MLKNPTLGVVWKDQNLPGASEVKRILKWGRWLSEVTADLQLTWLMRWQIAPGIYCLTR